MLTNTTDLHIKREPTKQRWEVIDPSTQKTVAHSSTWDGACRAAQEIKLSQMSAMDDVKVATRTFRETIRYSHLAKVLTERFRREQTV